MSQENVDAARRFKAVEERDLAGVLAAYDPDVVIREAASLIYGGVYHGLEGALRHAEQSMPKPGPRLRRCRLGDRPGVPRRRGRCGGPLAERGSASDGRKIDLPAVSIYTMATARSSNRKCSPLHKGDSGILRPRKINAHARERSGLMVSCAYDDVREGARV